MTNINRSSTPSPFVRFRLIIFLVFSVPFCGQACTCMSIAKLSKEDLAGAGTIFTGEAISVETDNYEKHILFVVQKAFLNTHENDTIEILTPVDSGACGLPVVEGEQWYIFIKKADGNHTNMCGRNINLTRKHYSTRKFGAQASYLNSEYRRNKKVYKRERRKLEYLLKEADPTP